MIQVVCVRNPFDPLASREIRKVSAGHQIRELVRGFDVHPGYDVAVSVDGRVLNGPEKMEHIPPAGSCVVFCAIPHGGDGKNPLAIVAALALMVAVPALTGPILGGMGGMASGAAIIANTALYIAGGLLIQAIFPMSTPDMGPNQLANSPTYSWDPSGNLIAEGGALPELFGTHRVTPPVVMRYVEVLGDRQFLNILYAVAGHYVDTISDVRINGTPIENFPDVTFDVRNGSSDQTVIPGFEKVRTDVPVGAKLQYDLDPAFGWTTRVTQGNAVDKLGVTIGFPKGLYAISGSGSVENVSVKIWLEYRKWTVGGTEDWIRTNFPNTVELSVTVNRWSGGYWDTSESLMDPPWIEVEVGSETFEDHTEGETYTLTINFWGVPTDIVGEWHWVTAGTIREVGDVSVDYIEVNAASTNPVYRSFFPTIDLTSDKYEIRCRLAEAPVDSIRWVQDAYFTSFQEIINEQQTHPGVALLGVRALATDQLSGGDIAVDCLAHRSTVPIYNGETLENKPSNNPAWASYYLLNRNGEGVAASRIDYAAFTDWAGKCNQQGYKVNLYVDSSGSLRRALDMVGLNGRGVTTQMGSKFTPLVDLPVETSVQRFLFTMGNIAADSFSQKWMSRADRANAVEVTYWDKDLDYTRQTVEIYADDFDTSPSEINKVSVPLYGCTDRAYATKYGKFLLACNRYLTLTASWDADVDAIACLPNDPVDAAHDVPRWGESGRIVSYTPATGVVILDREVTLLPATTYVMHVRRINDDSYDVFSIPSVGEETVTDTLTITLVSSTGGVGGATGDGAIADTTADGAYADDAADGAYTQDSGVGVYPGSVYSIGTVANVVKAMRVLNISRAGDLRKKLTCIEYVSDIYVDGVTY